MATNRNNDKVDNRTLNGVDVPSVNPPSVYDRRVDEDGEIRINNGDRVDFNGDTIDANGNQAAVGNQYGSRDQFGSRDMDRDQANKRAINAQEQRELAEAARLNPPVNKRASKSPCYDVDGNLIS